MTFHLRQRLGGDESRSMISLLVDGRHVAESKINGLVTQKDYCSDQVSLAREVSFSERSLNYHFCLDLRSIPRDCNSSRLVPSRNSCREGLHHHRSKLLVVDMTVTVDVSLLEDGIDFLLIQIFAKIVQHMPQLRCFTPCAHVCSDLVSRTAGVRGLP